MRKLLIIPSALISITILSFLSLTSNSISAESSTTSNVSVSVPVSCNITNTKDTPHTATINPGTYKEDIGTTTFKVFCNDNSGYSIYAIGYSNEEYGNTNLIPTNTTNPNIITGTATTGNTSNWSMKLNPLPGDYAPTIENDFSNYRTVPDIYTKVVTLTSNIDFTIGSTLQSTYKAYIQSNQPADTYTGKVKYTLVHPNDAEPPLQPVVTNPGYISYNPNATGVNDTMGDQSISNTATSAELWASNFKREGYGFAGWNDKFDYTGTNYGPNETISFTAGQYSGENKGLSLYAIWIKSAGNLQDWNGCSAMNTGDVTALTDQRDNNTYAVAKLADNNCWMIENLRLDNTNSDNATGALAQGYGTSITYGNFSGLAEPETSGFRNTYSANSLYSRNGGNNTINIDTSHYPATRMPRFNNQNTARPATNMDNPSGDTYSYGNYYTWPAAIADTSYYTSSDESVTGTSLCPKGWRLPQGGGKTRIEQENDNDFWNLAVVRLNNNALPNNYSSSTSEPYYFGDEATSLSNALRSFPNNFLYSGYFRDSSAGERGSCGEYRSNSAKSTNDSYSLGFGSSYVWPGTSDTYKSYGYSVRCLVGS